MTVTDFLNSRGFYKFEGYCGQNSQAVDLINLTSKPHINVMEIGFNAGHSAEIFLKNNPELTLTSFDLGSHEYCIPAKEYIDDTYPNRHTLILGDSQETIPKYYENNKNIKFDVIFIDGGHEYDTVTADLTNCFKLAHKETIVILDDIMYRKEWEAPWTVGPTQIWLEYINQNKVVEICTREYSSATGMSWGKYVF